MLRFSCSPTGDMHLNELRIALFNYIVAKQRNENLIVRIDDMDKEQHIEGKDQEILDILGLFQVEHAQVIYQSQNIRFHSAMALQLLHEKKAFSCFCSDGWLEKKRQEAKETNYTYHYDDACRNLPAELVIDNTAPFSVRIVRPDKPIIIQDKIQGKTSFDPDTIDSFVIMNQDKTPTHDFASAVDDMLNDISIIINEVTDMGNSAKQEHVRNQLSYEKTLEYAHMTPIMGGNTHVKQLLEEGYLPEAISNYLISIGNTTPKEIFTFKEAAQWFTFDTVDCEAVSFDIETLKHINKEHMRLLDPKELSRYVGFADVEIGELARLFLAEVSTTRELKERIMSIFSSRDIPEEFTHQTALITKTIQNAPYFEMYEDFKNYVIDKTKLNEDDFLRSLRVLLINNEKGPDIADIYKYLKNYIKEIIK